MRCIWRSRRSNRRTKTRNETSCRSFRNLSIRMTTTTKIAKPVDAAGLVLIRAAKNGEPEILLGRRHTKAGFLPDIYVVPGGKVDTADSAPSGFAETLTPAVETALRGGGSRRPALAFPRAALRETFEETGLLVGMPGKPVSESAGAIWQAYRDAGLAPAFGKIDY